MGASQSHSRKKSKRSSKTQTSIDTTIELIKITRGFVPFEPAQGVLDSLVAILTMTKTYLQNDDELSEIAARCGRVADLIKQSGESEKMSGAELRLKSYIDETLEALKQKHGRPRLRKALSVSGDSEEIAGLKEALRDFVAEFDIELGIKANKGVQELVQLVKASQIQQEMPPSSFFTPQTPRIFFGREDIVSTIVEDTRNEQHVVLVGTGGIGKSSISKAVLNDDAVISAFQARLFVTYDGVASSAMSFQVFLDYIAEALDLSKPSKKNILQRLRTLTALIVIDNAETFLEASPTDLASITEMLGNIGEIPGIIILMTTRNSETAPPSLNCHEIVVPGLSVDAASEAFKEVYTLHPVDDTIRSVLSELDYHPLSINILANTAKISRWSPIRLLEAWKEGQSRVLNSKTTDSKYRSLRVSIELSLSCAIFQDNEDATLLLLRAIALLPKGIHEADLSSIVLREDANTGNLADLLCQCSLAYWTQGRLTVLAPIRMYIADRYNENLPYSEPLIHVIRQYYYAQITDVAVDFVEREHANIDKLIHFDMLSDLYRSDLDIQLFVLQKTGSFLVCTSVQKTSLWPLLVSQAQDGSFDQPDVFAWCLSKCLAQACWAEYKRSEYKEALLKVEVAEKYCRDHSPVCNERLLRCLQMKGVIFRSYGNLVGTTTVLQEASSITESMDNPLGKVHLDQTIASVLLLQGETTRAEALLTSCQTYLESVDEPMHLKNLIVDRSYAAICRNDFHSARLFLENAQKLDQMHNGGKERLYFLNWQASCEGWAGDNAAALKILEEAAGIEVSPGTPQFRFHAAALRGKAYYEARMGNFANARKLIARAIELESETGGSWNDDYLSAFIECASGARSTALSMIQTIIDQYGGSDKQWMAIYHRTHGELMLMESRNSEAKAEFEKAKTICDSAGMSPRYLYVFMQHWYTLPAEYDGWTRFLDGVL